MQRLAQARLAKGSQHSSKNVHRCGTEATPVLLSDTRECEGATKGMGDARGAVYLRKHVRPCDSEALKKRMFARYFSARTRFDGSVTHLEIIGYVVDGAHRKEGVE